MTDILKGIEEDVRAMERIAAALERCAIVMEKRLAKDYPEHVKRDAIITKYVSPAESIQASLHAPPEEIEEALGLRERKFVEEHPDASAKPDKDQAAKV